MKEEHRVVRGPFGSWVALENFGTSGAETGHIASHNEMGTAVRALHQQVRMTKEVECDSYLWAFEIGLETDKIAGESIRQEVVVFFCIGAINHNGRVERGSQRIVGERVGYIFEGAERVSPSDAVGSWVHPDGVLEASGCDLAVIVGVTPPAQSTPFIILEHGRVLSIEGIWYTIFRILSLGKIGKDLPSVQSQYGVAPVYPHLSLNEFSKCLT